MFVAADQFRLSMNLLRGLAALGQNIPPTKSAQKELLAKLLVAELVDPRTTYIDTTTKSMYVAEIRMHCPDLFH